MIYRFGNGWIALNLIGCSSLNVLQPHLRLCLARSHHLLSRNLIPYPSKYIRLPKIVTITLDLMCPSRITMYGDNKSEIWENRDVEIPEEQPLSPCNTSFDLKDYDERLSFMSPDIFCEDEDETLINVVDVLGTVNDCPMRYSVPCKADSQE